VLAAQLVDDRGMPSSTYTPGMPLRNEVLLETDGTSRLSLELFLLDAARQTVGMASTHQFHGLTLPSQRGRYRSTIDLGPIWLASGNYVCDVATSVVNTHWDHFVENAFAFDVVFSNPGGQSWDFRHSLGYGSIAMPCTRTPSFVIAS
jgi:hypothetical protein